LLILKIMRLEACEQALSRPDSPLCTFMCCINVHKIYRMGADPSDKFHKFRQFYVHIKFIGLAKPFMQHLCYRLNAPNNM